MKIGYSLRRLGSRVAGDGETGYTINFYPDAPSFRYLAWKVCCSLGLRVTHKPFGKGMNVYWIDGTYHPSVHDEAINGRCVDISKIKVAALQMKIFGYSPDVDPTICSERMVVKSNINARHDGRIVQGPVRDPEKDMVYQRVIRNYVGNMVEELRVPIINNRIPFVYIKLRPVDKRFSRYNASTRLVDTQEVMSDVEVEKMLAFIREIGLDWGEIDALRDREDGKLYIIDANTTPFGLPHGIDPLSYNKALLLYGLEMIMLLEKAGKEGRIAPTD